MATLARESVEKAVQCIVEHEPELRVDVERLDKEIYRLEQIIEKRLFRSNCLTCSCCGRPANNFDLP